MRVLIFALLSYAAFGLSPLALRNRELKQKNALLKQTLRELQLEKSVGKEASCGKNKIWDGYTCIEKGQETTHEKECSDKSNTFVADWGRDSNDRCITWWNNGDWGAKEDCTNCDSAWAQSNCAHKCCQVCTQADNICADKSNIWTGPNWGTGPDDRCDGWWENHDWGAEETCNSCKAPWAQENCAYKCCQKCPHVDAATTTTRSPTKQPTQYQVINWLPRFDGSFIPNRESQVGSKQCRWCDCIKWTEPNYSQCSPIANQAAGRYHTVRCREDGITPMPGHWTSHDAECEKYSGGSSWYVGQAGAGESCDDICRGHGLQCYQKGLEIQTKSELSSVCQQLTGWTGTAKGTRDIRPHTNTQTRACYGYDLWDSYPASCSAVPADPTYARICACV